MRLVAFYRGGRDHRGRTLDDILQWDVDRLESTHDYIQWVFPLRERSGVNPSAPVLSTDEIATFRADADLQASLRRAWRVMIDFYGFTLTDADAPRLRRSADHRARTQVWLHRGNHNFLRLTRILKCLRTLGLETEARATFEALSTLAQEQPQIIGPTTYRFWQKAMEDDARH
jgi:hypothetical protein